MGIKHPTTVEEIPQEATIHLDVVGVKNTGGGRQVQAVNKVLPIHAFLQEYSELTVASKPDMNVIKQMTLSEDFGGAAAYLSKFKAQALQAKAATLTDIIVDAVATYLTTVEGIVESDTDPGEKFYFSRGDLAPQWVNGGKSGTMFCLVALTAPFGSQVR